MIIHKCTRAALSEHLAHTSSLLSSISLDGNPALILDTIKRGEDDEDVSRGELPTRAGKSIILRIYESLGGKARGTLKLGAALGVKSVHQTNLLEDDEGRCAMMFGLANGKEVKIELRAFEVATFRLQL